MASSESNTKFKDKVRKEFLRNSKIATGSKKSSTCNHKFVIPSILGSISKFQEKVSFPDNPNEVSLHRTRTYEKTVYRTSDIDKASHKPLTGKKVESKNLLHKCELIAEIEKQLRHLQGQKKYLQMPKEAQQNQSWRESLSANQSIKTKKHLSKQGCTEKVPNGCDSDTRQVRALLQVLIEKNCVKVTDSSTQIETPIKKKKINGEDYSPSYLTQNIHLSSDTSSVNVLWKGETNSRKLRKTSVKMVNSSTQVGSPVGGSKHRSTQVSIKIAGSRKQVNNPIRVPKQRLGRKQHLVSSESSNTSPTFRRPEPKAKEIQQSPTNQREDYSHERSKSYHKSLENKLDAHVEKKGKTRNRNINTIESSKSVAVLKSKEKRLSLTPRTSNVNHHSPEKELQRFEVLVEEMVANPRKTVRSDNRKSSTKSHARSKTQIQQSPHREYITTSEYRGVQASFKTKSHQMTPLADFHSPIPKQISRQTFTIRAQRTNIEQSRQNDSSSVSQIIVSSTRKTVQTRKASQKAYIKSTTQSYKDCKQEHRVKNPYDLSREPSVTPHWNSISVRPNVIDDRTYIIPDTDKSEDYIVLPYVHNPNDVESPPDIKSKGTTNSQDNLSKNVIKKSSVIIREDASTRESYANTLTTPRVLLNGMEDMSNTLGSTQINVSIPPASDQFNQSTPTHHNKMISEARKSSNSDASVGNQMSNLGKVSTNLESESDSISTLSQQHEVIDMSKQSSQKNNLFRSHSSGLKDESIRSEVSNDPRTNTPTTSHSNRSNTEHMSDLTDISITNQSHQSEIKAMSQPKLQTSNKMLTKNSFKSPRKENVLKTELSKNKDMSYQSELGHDLQNNPSNWKSSIDSDLSKHEDISFESGFIHELQKIRPTSHKDENEDDLLDSKTNIFNTVQNKEHLSKSKTDRSVEHTDIIRQTELKVFKSDVNNSTANNKRERSSKSDLELKSPPSMSKSVSSANQSPKMTYSDRSFTLKPIVQSKMHADIDHCIPTRTEHCTPKRVEQKSDSHRGSNKLKTENRVLGDSKIDEVHDVRKSSKLLAQTLVNPFTDNEKAETNKEHESISRTAVVTKIPSELLNYIQYLQNRLKDCDEMVEKQTHYQSETFQSNDGLKVENPPNCERGSIQKENINLSSLIKRERSTDDEGGEEAEKLLLIGDREEFDASLDSVSKFEISCCCSCCGEDQSTSYHSDIPLFTGCDCMKEGYYQIMRLAYGK